MDETQALGGDDWNIDDADEEGEDDGEAGTLILQSDGGDPQNIPLRFGPITLGRCRDGNQGSKTGVRSEDLPATIMVDDPSLSKHHARIELNASGAIWFLTDLGSKNGTFLLPADPGSRATRCEPGVKYGIGSGTAVRFGSKEATVLLRPPCKERDERGKQPPASCAPKAEGLAQACGSDMDAAGVQVRAAAQGAREVGGDKANVQQTDEDEVSRKERLLSAETQLMEGGTLHEDDLLNAETEPPVEGDYLQGNEGLLHAKTHRGGAETLAGPEGRGGGGGTDLEMEATELIDATEPIGTDGGEAVRGGGLAGELQGGAGMSGKVDAATAIAGAGGSCGRSHEPPCSSREAANPRTPPPAAGSGVVEGGWRKSRRTRGSSAGGPSQEGCPPSAEPLPPTEMEHLDSELVATAEALRQQLLREARETLPVRGPREAIAASSFPSSSPGSATPAREADEAKLSAPGGFGLVTGGWRVKSQKPETTSSLRSNGIRAGPSRDKQNGSQALQAIEPTLPVGKDEQPVEEGVQQAVGSGEAMGWGGTVLRRDRDGGEGAEGVSGSCLMKARGLRGAELCDDPGGISESTEPPEEGDSEAQEATAARRPTGMPAKPEELNAGGSSDSTELPEEEDLVEEVSSKEPPGRTDEHNAEKPEAEELLLEAAEGSESVTEVIEDSAPAETEDAAHCVSSSALGIGAERKEITGREVADDREKERSGAPRERGMVIAGAEAARPACALSGEESGEGGKEVAGGGEKAGVAAEEVVEEDEGAKELGKQEDVAERTVGEGIEGLEAPVDGKESKEETAVEGTVEDEFVVEETVEVEMDGEAEEAVEGEKAAALAVRESGGDDGEKEGQQVDPGASGMSPPQCLAEAEGGMEPHHPPAGDETQAAAAALEEFGADAEGLEEAAVSPEIEVGGTQTPGKETQGAAAALGGLRRLGEDVEPPSLGKRSRRTRGSTPDTPGEPASKRGRSAKRGGRGGRGRGNGTAVLADGQGAAVKGRTRRARAPEPKEAPPSPCPEPQLPVSRKRSRAPCLPEADDPARPAGVRVAFSTCIGASLLQKNTKVVEDLGGSVCSSKDFDFTHYVTMAGKAKDGKGFIRSLKTLLALAGGRPIVEIKWLADSRREGAFVPASAHLLQDTEKEKEYGFSISGSFQAARSRLVFEGVEIFFTPSFLKEEKDGGKDIRTIVMTAGALVAASPPQRLRKRQGGGEEKGLGALVVAVPSDREWAGRALRNGVPILGRDHLLRAVMRQKPPGPQDCLFTT